MESFLEFIGSNLKEVKRTQGDSKTPIENGKKNVFFLFSINMTKT